MAPSQPDGFLALPPGGRGYPVLLLHAWWGLNETIKGIGRQLAEAGFLVFAPDLYHGQVTAELAGAESLSGDLFANLDKARAGVREAAAVLDGHPGRSGRGLAVMGFSLGAFFALDLSVSEPERVRSVVVFYGTRPGDYDNARASFLGHFAEVDDFEPASEVDGLESALRRAGRPVTFHRYAGVGHWFFESDRLQAYDEAAARLAWERTLAFLKQTSNR